jgi:hypothetical protein
MKGFRFSLWSMFLGIAAVAIVCAALAKPTAAWAMAFQAAALGLLTFALLAALVYERGAARAFWIGFAVVGWGNLGLHPLQILEVSLTREISERLMDAIHPYPPSDPEPPLYLGLEAPIEPVDPAFDPYSNVPEATTTTKGDPAGPVPPQPAAYDVGEARTAFPYLFVWIWALLLGFIGGVVAQQLYLRRERLAANRSQRGASAN